jgi:hypothetical protein
MTSRANALRQRICDQFIRGVVNGARTRVIALRRILYVGEDANGNVRKRTKETVFLSICMVSTDDPGRVACKKRQRDLESA